MQIGKTLPENRDAHCGKAAGWSQRRRREIYEILTIESASPELQERPEHRMAVAGAE